MTTTLLSPTDIDIAEVEYLRHGDRPLLARVFRPRGQGPFPMMIELHGGGWVKFDRMEDEALNRELAKEGVVVVALDFRCPPQAIYPGSLIDINYAIRWFKQRAASFGSSPDKVGIMGCSSGGHLAMLSAMRPQDSRYTALPAENNRFDASVGCVVTCWPVIDPLGRYHYAKELQKNGAHPEFVESTLPAHERYWETEAAMEEGNPLRALERGEKLQLPPVLYIQGTSDYKHPVPHLRRFVDEYTKAGGRIELEMYDGEIGKFIQSKPDSENSRLALQKIAQFVHAELG